jgi:hypothetical protein
MCNAFAAASTHLRTVRGSEKFDCANNEIVDEFVNSAETIADDFLDAMPESLDL